MRKSGFIAIAGRPNAGKSTLLNKILGTSLSIVSPKAQTTRERVLGIFTEAQGQIVFIDTPGIHRAKEGSINAFMVKEAKEALEDVSLIWYLVDPYSQFEHEKVVLELLETSDAPVFVLWNKLDLRAPAESLQLEIRKILGDRLKSEFLISGLRDKGIQELIDASWNILPEGPFHFEDEDQLTDKPTRFFVAEQIRRQLFVQLGEELPYSCAVEIKSFNEKSKPVRIEAVIHVERDSQKGMVIGAKGAKIKAIGQEARLEIEKFLGYPIFLGLQVDVLKDWTKDPRTMKKLGYTLGTQ